MGIIGPGVLAGHGGDYGVPLWVEIKTGKDKLREEQIAAHRTARLLGCVVIVASDFQDFKRKWEELIN